MTAPAPLTLPMHDVRDLDGFMLNVEKLMASELMALATGDQFKAAISLWCRAWKQIPAGSLPDDDAVLAAFSGAGPKWRKVKDMALRGFVKCSDGRLYHTTLCADVLRAFDSKLKYQADREADRERLRQWRERKRQQRPIDVRNGDGDLTGMGCETDIETGFSGVSGSFGNSGETPNTVQDDTIQDGKEESLGGDNDPPWPGAAPPSGGAKTETQPELIPTESHANDKRQQTASRRGSRLNPDWRPDQSILAIAEGLGLDPEWELAKFRDYWTAKAGKDACKLDWSAAYRNWCRNSYDRKQADRSGSGHARQGGNRPGGGGILAAAREVAFGGSSGE